MTAVQIAVGKPENHGGAFIGLHAAMERWPGFAYSSLRAYIKSGRLPAFRTPSGKLWVRPADVEASFRPVEPKHQPTQKDLPPCPQTSTRIGTAATARHSSMCHPHTPRR